MNEAVARSIRASGGGCMCGAVRLRAVGEPTGGSVTLGLVPAPELPEMFGRELATELPELLREHVDGDVSWEVSALVDSLTGTDLKSPELLDACQERLHTEGWDIAVCLTDLSVYRNGNLIVADTSAERKIAGLSLPALGVTRLRTRALEMTLQLVYELHARIPELAPDDRSPDSGEEKRSGKRPPALIAPFRKVEPPDEDMKEIGVDARFAAPGVLGHLSLLSGMVLANRPWKLLPCFKGALAAAFATAAYALVIPTIWMLADSVGWARLLLLMVAAIAAMCV